MADYKRHNLKDVKDTQASPFVSKGELKDVRKSLQSKVVFFNKKSIRVLSAITLMADFLPAGDFLTPKLQSSVLSILEDLIWLENLSTSEMMGTISRRYSDWSNLSSLIRFAELTGRFSAPNSHLILDQISHLQTLLSDIKNDLLSGVPVVSSVLKSDMDFDFSPSWFLVKEEDNGDINSDLQSNQKNTSSNSYDEVGNIDQNSNLNSFNNNQIPQSISPLSRQANDKQASGLVAIDKVSVNNNTKSDRVAKIMGTLSRLGEATVTQVAEVFPDISSKTIQRDLSKLVQEGKVKSVGERRWTKYSLL